MATPPHEQPPTPAPTSSFEMTDPPPDDASSTESWSVLDGNTAASDADTAHQQQAMVEVLQRAAAAEARAATVEVCRGPG